MIIKDIKNNNLYNSLYFNEKIIINIVIIKYKSADLSPVKKTMKRSRQKEKIIK